MNHVSCLSKFPLLLMNHVSRPLKFLLNILMAIINFDAQNVFVEPPYVWTFKLLFSQTRGRTKGSFTIIDIYESVHSVR